MTNIPSNLTRVPSLLASQTMLNSIQGTSRDLLELQVKLASGRKRQQLDKKQASREIDRAMRR